MSFVYVYWPAVIHWGKVLIPVQTREYEFELVKKPTTDGDAK